MANAAFCEKCNDKMATQRLIATNEHGEVYFVFLCDTCAETGEGVYKAKEVPGDE